MLLIVTRCGDRVIWIFKQSGRDCANTSVCALLACEKLLQNTEWINFSSWSIIKLLWPSDHQRKITLFGCQPVFSAHYSCQCCKTHLPQPNFDAILSFSSFIGSERWNEKWEWDIKPVLFYIPRLLNAPDLINVGPFNHLWHQISCAKVGVLFSSFEIPAAYISQSTAMLSLLMPL